MAFDKQQYWDNRKEGLRGQGEKPSLDLTPLAEPDTEVKHVGRVGDKVVPINRATSRRKMVARLYSGKDDVEGMKHTQKGAPHGSRRTLFQREGIHYPTQDPKLSNNKRVIKQRIQSGRWDISKLPAGRA